MAMRGACDWVVAGALAAAGFFIVVLSGCGEENDDTSLKRTATGGGAGFVQETPKGGRRAAAPLEDDVDGDGVPTVAAELTGEVDCAPTDPSRWKLYYVDRDGDGVAPMARTTECGGAQPGPKQTPIDVSPGTAPEADCNDEDATAFRLAVPDADGDGAADTFDARCVGELPLGWVALKDTNWEPDCAPQDATRSKMLGKDRDGDGAFGASQCEAGVATNGPPDCDDTNPDVAATVSLDKDGDGISGLYCGNTFDPSGSDCDDGDSTVGELQFPDPEGDGIGLECADVAGLCAAPRPGWSSTRLTRPECSAFVLERWSNGDPLECRLDRGQPICFPCLDANDCLAPELATTTRTTCTGPELRLVTELRSTGCNGNLLVAVENVGNSAEESFRFRLRANGIVSGGGTDLEFGERLEPGQRSRPFFAHQRLRVTLLAGSGCTVEQTSDIGPYGECFW